MKTTKKLALILLSLLFTCLLYAQTSTTIKGKASIAEGDFYHAAALSVVDSTVVLSSGYFFSPEFELQNIKLNEFILQLSSPMLFETYTQRITCDGSTQTIDVGFIQLQPVANMLNEAQVTATVPKASYRDGRVVYNVQNNNDFKAIESSSDILKRLPLVSVSNNNVSMFGKKNTIVLINGQPAKNNDWEQIPPENIKEVEVITNPSAEYSASGMAIINIVTKQRVAEGFNGVLSSVVVKGEFWRISNSLQLDYATSKLNVYANLRYNPYKRQFVDSYERYFADGSKLYNELVQDRTATNPYSIVAGVDYDINTKNTIGFQYQRTHTTTESETNNAIDIFTPSNTSRYETLRNVNAPLSRNIYDLSYTLAIDSLGKKLSLGAGYVDYSSNENSTFSEHSAIDKQKQSYSVADIQLYTANADYTHKTANGFTGKLGAYYSHNQNDSRYAMQNVVNGSIIDDENFSNATEINEDRFAAYFTARKSWDKFYLSAGLRYEYVCYANKSRNQDKLTKSYNDLFPSAEVGYTFSDDVQASLSYAKKVHYPKFQDLNPSMIYVDTLTYFMGNTNLRPEYSHNLALNVVYLKYLNISLGYNHINNPLYMFVRRYNPNSMIGIASTENLKSEDTWTASLSLPYSYKFWTTYNTLGVSYSKNRFEIEGTPTNRSKAMVYAYAYNGFDLSSGFNISLTYQYNSSGINGIFYHGEHHILSCALTKSLLNNNLTLTLKYDDIFKQDKQNTRADLDNMTFVYGAKYDASYLSFSVRYKFGKSAKKYQLKENNKEELNRIK